MIVEWNKSQIEIPDRIGFPDDGGSFLQSPEEIKELVNILLPKKLKFVVEIGTGLGGTAFIWAQMCQRNNGVVVTVDTVDFDKDYNIDMWTRLYSDYIRKVRGNSHDQSTLFSVKSLVPYADMLFIDGDHSLEGARLDFDMYSELVVAGGIIVLHDIRNTLLRTDLNVLGTHVLWDELKSKYKNTIEIIGTSKVSFTETKDSPGIGVIFLDE